jgi:hypothetical protein
MVPLIGELMDLAGERNWKLDLSTFPRIKVVFDKDTKLALVQLPSKAFGFRVEVNNGSLPLDADAEAVTRAAVAALRAAADRIEKSAQPKPVTKAKAA